MAGANRRCHRTQLQSVTKMQIQMMDHMMDAWEDQIKSPNPTTASSAMSSKLKPFPSVSPAWPNAEAFSLAAMNTMQFWLQLAEQWQKAWADAMAFWAKAGRPLDGLGQGRR
jgi:hypothetical protein